MEALSDTLLLQADVTAYDDDARGIMEIHGIVGPPAILFFGKQGKEKRGQRVIGFMDAPRFRKHVVLATM